MPSLKQKPFIFPLRAEDTSFTHIFYFLNGQPIIYWFNFQLFFMIDFSGFKFLEPKNYLKLPQKQHDNLHNT
jgi:hypothetical protein